MSSGPSEQHARRHGGGARWRRIEQLSRALAEQLSDDARAVWLELEEALTAHWLDVAGDHYRRGFAAGSAEQLTMMQAADRSTAQARLSALITLLSEVADELETD